MAKKLYQSNQPNFNQEDWAWAKANLKKMPGVDRPDYFNKAGDWKASLTPGQQAAVDALMGSRPTDSEAFTNKWNGKSWAATINPGGGRVGAGEVRGTSTPSVDAFDPTALATDQINQATFGFGDDIGSDPALQAAQDFQSGVLSGGNLPYSERAKQGILNRQGDASAFAAAHAAKMLREQMSRTGITGSDPSGMAALRAIETGRMQQNQANLGDVENLATQANFSAQSNASSALAQQKLAQLAQQGNAYSQGAQFTNQTQSGGDHVSAGFQGPPQIGNMGAQPSSSGGWQPPAPVGQQGAAPVSQAKPAQQSAGKWTMPQSTMQQGAAAPKPTYGPQQNPWANGAVGPQQFSFQNMNDAGVFNQPKSNGIVRPSQGTADQYALKQLNARLRN